MTISILVYFCFYIWTFDSVPPFMFYGDFCSYCLGLNYIVPTIAAQVRAVRRELHRDPGHLRGRGRQQLHDPGQLDLECAVGKSNLVFSV